MERLHHGQRLLAIRRLVDHLNAVLLREDQAEPLSGWGVIVGNQDRDPAHDGFITSAKLDHWTCNIASMTTLNTANQYRIK